MEEIKFLIHTTSLKSAKKILRGGYLLTDYDRQLEGIKARGANSNPGDSWLDYQYPGVYMGYITEGNISGYSFFSQVSLIFSKKLLEDRNDYHVNNSDNFGEIRWGSETSFPGSLNIACNSDFNEIVFHSKVSLRYLIKIVSHVGFYYDSKGVVIYERKQGLELTKDDLLREAKIERYQVKSGKVIKTSLDYGSFYSHQKVHPEKMIGCHFCEHDPARKRRFIHQFIIEYYELRDCHP